MIPFNLGIKREKMIQSQNAMRISSVNEGIYMQNHMAYTYPYQQTYAYNPNIYGQLSAPNQQQVPSSSSYDTQPPSYNFATQN